jgi:hypothetical protein
MVTTIIAIYGAVVATASTALGAWYFLYSGPRLQAEAIVYSEKENGGEWDDDSTILLNVWNTGRAEITMNIMYIMINHDNDCKTAWPFERTGTHLRGPEVPMRIPGHSGETWKIQGLDLPSMIDEPWTSATLSVLLMVAGSRTVEIPVWEDSYRRTKRRYILKRALSQPD